MSLNLVFELLVVHAWTGQRWKIGTRCVQHSPSVDCPSGLSLDGWAQSDLEFLNSVAGSGNREPIAPGLRLLYAIRSRSLKIALAAWLAVSAAMSSLTHAHAGGELPHSHGLGWLTTGSAPDGARQDSPSVKHSHLIVLGIEIFTLCPDPFGTDADRAPNKPSTVVVLLLPEAANPAEAPWIPAPQNDWSAPIISPEPLADGALQSIASLTPCPPRLCAMAARSRTGVLRA